MLEQIMIKLMLSNFTGEEKLQYPFYRQTENCSIVKLQWIIKAVEVIADNDKISNSDLKLFLD